LIDKLLSEGKDLTLLVRDVQSNAVKGLISSCEQKFDRPQINLVEFELTKEDLALPIDFSSKKFDHVYHLAAIYDLTSSKVDMLNTNVEGTRRLLFRLKKDGFKGRFHFVSSIAVAGDFSGRFDENMFDENHPAPTFEEFDESDHYYTGHAHKDGSYLLIVYENEVIGSISYACGYEKRHYAEIDIWLGSLKYTGKGIGPRSIQMIMDFVHDTYAIKTFMIRPWIKNTNAIKAYKKCGFIEIENKALNEYYSDEDFKEYGEGDYGVEETVNLLLVRK